ncbi:hypothetical protein YPPY66_3999, partial [Yersinia pestis PY-66]
MTNGPTVTSKA